MFPAGHYYSPLPDLEEVRRNEKTIFDRSTPNLSGINLNESGQINFFHECKKFYKELPFPAQKKEEYRYFYENPSFSYADAIMLFFMIRFLKPKKIIEIGSGCSSRLILDTNEFFFKDKISVTCIEPYPDLLLSLIKKEDRHKITLLDKKLQDCDLSLFSSLEKNDILFIDSTHVSKIGSDVNLIFFKILPLLREGVHIHFHDVFFPFEYLKEWVYEGRAWNENYILRAFLEYNEKFTIVFFNSFIAFFHLDLFQKWAPLCLKNTGGSFWMKKGR